MIESDEHWREMVNRAALALTRIKNLKPLVMKPSFNAPWRKLWVSFRPGQEKAAISALVKGVRRSGFRRFGVLQTPVAGAKAFIAKSREHRVSVRLVLQYDIVRDETRRQLDVLGRN